MFSNLLTTCASLEFVSHTFGSQRLLSQALLAEAIGWIVCQCTEERSAVGAQSRRCHDNSNPSYSPICTSNPTLRPGCTHGRCSTVASLPKQIFYSRAPVTTTPTKTTMRRLGEEAGAKTRCRRIRVEM